MDTSGWIPTTREDGETVGYLEPVTADYGLVQPRNLLGHPVGGPAEFMEAEDLLIERGISELAGRWTLRGVADDLRDGVVILEASPDGIVVAHGDLAKAGIYGRRVRVGWPDAAGLLTRSATEAH
ncbi:hypothetical protein [Arthrobacter sp. JSM 101049]|uniref:hypothetical protein n=1 Tax=Arthrobacter sp. JSM 101049 TaxID=929097 RepID=UPI0035641737